MNHDGKLLLYLHDVYGKPLKGRVDIHLDHTRLFSASGVVRDRRVPGRLTIPELHDGVYKISIYPTLYFPVSQFVMINEGQIIKRTITFPIDPEKVIGIDAPAFEDLPDDIKQVLQNSNVESYPDQKGEALYSALDDLKKAGLLNVYHKMRATVLPGGKDTFSYVTSLTRIRGDRFFAKVHKELLDEVKNGIPQNLFREVPNMDHTPPPNYQSVGSLKTLDKYGNLQLTFFCNTQTLDFIIDADIDDASGLLHSFQVIEHYLTGRGTHPFDIHEILLQTQQLDPGYQLLV